MTTVGGLCEGYGGLSAAIPDAELVWYAENDPHAQKILATHMPAVPNLDDLTTVDWSTVPRVEVLTAGYPCQPFSHAGRRKGTDDERHLWPHITEAIRVLRPRRVLLENVAGHLSLGFGTVVGDLAALGYVGRWACVRASDVGAPHRRERVFVVATDTRGAGTGWDVGAVPRPVEESGRPGADVHAAVVADRDAVADAAHIGHERGGRTRGRGDGPADSGDTSTDADGGRLEGSQELNGQPATDPADWDSQGRHPHGLADPARFGIYEPAIRRWEHLTRPAPAPTDDRRRLNPAFVEWMMGLPEGWVTGIDITRTAQLKALGNGVVRQQAQLAWRMLTDETVATLLPPSTLLPTPTARDWKGQNQRRDTTCLPGALASLEATP